ncbi:galectin-9-like [Haliotis asinina]|uniref:galectin-9-like n=1 Tax=Haliotis asinina TaxID=109174 RepID=UPI003531F5B5
MATTIPYVQPIQGGLRNGQMVIVEGSCGHDQNEFSINLSKNPHVPKLRDTVFHFNVRFKQNAVVRNTQEGDDWGPEETEGEMPLAKGAPFKISILAETYRYQIYVNDYHFANYRHRIPMKCVEYLIITGQVHVTLVKIEDCACPAPPPYPGDPPMNRK